MRKRNIVETNIFTKYKMKRFIVSLLCACFCMSFMYGADHHFLTEPNYRQRVAGDFNKRMQLMGTKFFATSGMNLSLEEKEALEFLYAYMPLADVTDYSTPYYLQNVREAFRARSEMAWRSKIPEMLFRHFVLPIRVNNENLDTSRGDFYKELKQRVAGKDMKSAILEVNHWCHEKVTYTPSDGRTSSPSASVKSAYGRCGEESTFTVAALRSVGIPARQVYTPRWAHTDDNHTRVVGHYHGPEEVMLETGTFTEINLIDNYAETARTDFKVLDAAGKPVAH